MATEIVRPRGATRRTHNETDAAPAPLSATAREIGSEATAEIIELVGLMLDQRQNLSGFAMRGLLIRVQSLAGTAQGLFDGFSEDPYEVAASVGGACTKQAVAWSEKLRSESAAS